MVKNLLKRSLILTPLILLNLISCIDKDYDLSDLDTDEVTIGDVVVIPLGTGVITADDLMDVEDIEEIQIDPVTGEYAARYKGDLYLELKPEDMPEPDLEDDIAVYAKVKLPDDLPLGSSGVTIKDFLLEIPEEVDDISFDTGREGEVIERIVFRGENMNRPFVTLNVDFDQLDIESKPENNITLEIEFPSGYSFVEEEIRVFGGGSVTIVSNILTYTSPAATGIRKIELPLDEVVVNEGDQIKLRGFIDIISGSYVEVGSALAHPYVDVKVDFELEIVEGNQTVLGYEAIYGKFNVEFKSEDPAYFDVSGLNDIFIGEDDLLSFVNPSVKIDAYNTNGVPVALELDLTALNVAGNPIENVNISEVSIAAPRNYGDFAESRIWVGESAPTVPGYEFVQNPNINNLFKNSPETIEFEATVKSDNNGQTMFVAPNTFTQVDYEVIVPLTPASDFKATIEQIIDDVFDEDLIEYVFSSGTAELYGTIDNGFPLDFDLEMIITDENGQDIGLVFESQQVKACISANQNASSSVSFKFSERHMENMRNAKDIVLLFKAKGTNLGIAMNENQQIILNLKIKKTGGILINNKD